MMDKKHISQDAYDMWRGNEVTIRFLAEIQEDINAAKDVRIHGTSEQIVKQNYERNVELEILECMIDWRPAELEIVEEENE